MEQEQHLAIVKRLSQLQLVPVVSLPSIDAGLKLAEILIRHQLPVMEVTFRTPCAAEAICEMKRAYSELFILAGTILTTEQLRKAIMAGAECVVTPGFHRTLVEECQKEKILICPGVVTPTEVLQCLDMGLHTMKFFPAEVSGGVDMLKALSAVYADVQFMPTGGITPENMASYLFQDTVFCCGGSWLAPYSILGNKQWDLIEERIAAAKVILQQIKQRIND